jgi:hypothetical protein
MVVRMVVYSLHVHNVCMNMSSVMVAYVFLYSATLETPFKWGSGCRSTKAICYSMCESPAFFFRPLRSVNLSKYPVTRIFLLSLNGPSDTLRTEEARTGIHRSLCGKR